MITLHRLGHLVEAFHLNPDLIMTVEANPDTVITLVNGHKIVVAEPPERVARDHAQYRAEVLAAAMTLREQQEAEQSNVVRRLVRRSFPSTALPMDTPADSAGAPEGSR